MKRPTMLVKAILADARLDLDLSVERDAHTIARRCEHEGVSFLTLTLPTLSDALERGIESGTFTCPTSFSRHGSLPRLLSGFFKRVFTIDGSTGPVPGKNGREARARRRKSGGTSGTVGKTRKTDRSGIRCGERPERDHPREGGKREANWEERRVGKKV
jgi:hypothetical protein